MESITEIIQRLQEYYEAFHLKNWEKFAYYLSDSFKYFTDGTLIMNKNEFIEFLKKDIWQPEEYSINDVKIHLSENGDMAVAAYKTSFTGISDNNKMTIKAIETTIFVKEKGSWKIIHSHTSNKV